MNATTARWFAEYAADHRHPMNRLTHKVAIPAIVFHILTMLTWVELGSISGFPITLGLIGWALAVGFWTFYLPRAGLLLGLATLPVLIWGALVPAPVVIAIAIVGWTVQLAGHSVWEKNRPSFLKNAAHALIGPLFFTAVLTGQFAVPRAAEH